MMLDVCDLRLPTALSWSNRPPGGCSLSGREAAGLLLLFFAVVAMSGCAVPQPESGLPEQPVPAAWSTHPDSASLSDVELAQWWREFEDPALDRLVTMALASNIDLASATARVREARAQREVSHAQLWPNLYATGSGSRTTSSQAVGAGDTNELFSAGFEAGWEPDVFGYRRLGLAAADAEVAASEEALHNARVSLLAELAANYVDLRTAETRLDILRSTLAARAATYELTQWRLQAGLVSELDVAQALTELDSARSAIPALRTAVTEARNRLGVLLATAPDQVDATLAAASGIPVGSRIPSPGIPADLLRRRPDVRAAERTLAAQAARLAQARAERYPVLSLSGFIGVEALSVGALNDDGASRRTLLGNLTAPIFDAGRIAGNVELQDARLEQARLAYRQSVLLALEEVENALAATVNAAERLVALRSATAAAAAALEMAEQRYASGLIDYLAVLVSQRTLLVLEEELATSTGSLAISQIRLYKALGGGWAIPDSRPSEREAS